MALVYTHVYNNNLLSFCAQKRGFKYLYICLQKKKKKLPMKYTFKFIIKRKNFNSLSICLLFLEALSRKQLNKIYYALEIKSSQIFMNFRKRREREKQSIKYNVFTLYNFIFHRSICVCVCV
jgi:hypothetical protein